MRELSCNAIANAVERLCIRASYDLPADVEDCIRRAGQQETSAFGKYVINKIEENITYARENKLPLCQDTGTAFVIAEIGQELVLTGGNVNDAINEGVRRGYKNGYLRKSIVKDPIFDRTNTQDNTPAVFYCETVPGDRMKIMLLPKGGGGENCGALKMLRPADGMQGVKDFILQTINEAGGKPCPPVIIGVGVGGTLDKAAYLSKRALCRDVGQHNPNPNYAALEEEMLRLVNNTGIGPQGLGGNFTALAVNIEYFPCHIASLPVAITINCHCSRFAEVVL